MAERFRINSWIAEQVALNFNDLKLLVFWKGGFSTRAAEQAEKDSVVLVRWPELFEDSEKCIAK